MCVYGGGVLVFGFGLGLLLCIGCQLLICLDIDMGWVPMCILIAIPGLLLGWFVDEVPYVD